MVRGRLVADQRARACPRTEYADERARRLVDREFNLSWAERMQPDNRVVAGRWWTGPSGGARRQFSVEGGLAETLGMKLGDTLTFDIAGTPVSGHASRACARSTGTPST